MCGLLTVCSRSAHTSLRSRSATMVLRSKLTCKQRSSTINAQELDDFVLCRWYSELSRKATVESSVLWHNFVTTLFAFCSQDLHDA